MVNSLPIAISVAQEIYDVLRAVVSNRVELINPTYLELELSLKRQVSISVTNNCIELYLFDRKQMYKWTFEIIDPKCFDQLAARLLFLGVSVVFRIEN